MLRGRGGGFAPATYDHSSSIGDSHRRGGFGKSIYSIIYFIFLGNNNTTQTPSRLCYLCGKTDHVVKDCPDGQYNRRGTRQQQKATAPSANAYEQRSSSAIGILFMICDFVFTFLITDYASNAPTTATSTLSYYGTRMSGNNVVSTSSTGRGRFVSLMRLIFRRLGGRLGSTSAATARDDGDYINMMLRENGF
jgi:hypothetical protein